MTAVGRMGEPTGGPADEPVPAATPAAASSPDAPEPSARLPKAITVTVGIAVAVGAALGFASIGGPAGLLLVLLVELATIAVVVRWSGWP